jgi:hypothetical protein
LPRDLPLKYALALTFALKQLQTKTNYLMGLLRLIGKGVAAFNWMTILRNYSVGNKVFSSWQTRF